MNPTIQSAAMTDLETTINKLMVRARFAVSAAAHFEYKDAHEELELLESLFRAALAARPVTPAPVCPVCKGSTYVVTGSGNDAGGEECPHCIGGEPLPASAPEANNGIFPPDEAVCFKRSIDCRLGSVGLKTYTELEALAAPTQGAPEALARRFHEAYERLAPSFGYETRTETRDFNPETPNGKLMIAVCAALAAPSTPPQMWEHTAGCDDAECSGECVPNTGSAPQRVPSVPLAAPSTPAAEMDAAIAAGDGTLHGAIDHWQRRALKAEAATQAQASDKGAA